MTSGRLHSPAVKLVQLGRLIPCESRNVRYIFVPGVGGEKRRFITNKKMLVFGGGCRRATRSRRTKDQVGNSQAAPQKHGILWGPHARDSPVALADICYHQSINIPFSEKTH